MFLCGITDGVLVMDWEYLYGGELKVESNEGWAYQIHI